jgi:hypothetical protein
MKLIKLFLFILFPISGFSQIQGEGEVYLTQERIDAKFGGGGIENFTAFIKRNFDYSKVTKAGKLEGAFTIDEQGNVIKIRITQVLDIESATEFIRVLKMCPKWEPAKRGGKPISIEIKYPMVFNAKATHEPNATAPTENEDDKGKLYNTAGVEKKPDFPGGLQEFYNYIGKNYKTPDVKGLAGKVFVTFVVEKDGSITDVKVLRDIGYGTGEEAVRVLRNSPNWIPAEQNGKKVRVQYSLPINIKAN